MKRVFALFFLFCSFSVLVQTSALTNDGYSLLRDIPYTSVARMDGKPEEDAYKLERCKLDLYYPEEADDFATLVWYHGGGLTGGNKHIPEEFRRQGFAVVSVNYRLSPRATCPAYLEDAAQALAWVFRHIQEYGGSADKVFVSGHSAGGYLALMLALDKSWTAAYGLDADRIVKAYPISGQTNTHYTIRKERGLPDDLPVIDAYAPVNRVRAEGCPLMLITGDRSLEMLARYEENAHLAAILKHFGHPSQLFELNGFDHGTVLGPACYLIRADIRRLTRKTDGRR
jgi:acetyl esterase/lipase